jgi:peptidoglycan/LPS O-acetylase OafA/YrhL
MYLFDEDVFVPFLVFAVPIVAIAGGILAGIIRSISAHHLMEVALRERMALIARGVDPARIPGLSTGAGLGLFPQLSFADHSRLRAQGLLIGGLVTLLGGLALGAFLGLTESWESHEWTFALVPVCIGLALLVSSLIVRAQGGDGGSRAPSRVA